MISTNLRKLYPLCYKPCSHFSSTVKGKICVTTPIFYVNSEPHIGHLYSMIYTDAIAKWKKIDGYNVIFSTGKQSQVRNFNKKVLMNMAKKFKMQLRLKMSRKLNTVINMLQGLKNLLKNQELTIMYLSGQQKVYLQRICHLFY